MQRSLYQFDRDREKLYRHQIEIPLGSLYLSLFYLILCKDTRKSLKTFKTLHEVPNELQD